MADAVLDQTLSEVAEHGVERLSIDRIARAADVNKTSIYRRWPTRGALIAAALERVMLDLRAQPRASPVAPSVREGLTDMASRIHAVLREPLGKELLRAALTREAEPELKQLAKRYLSTSQPPPRAAQPDMREEVDPALLLDLVVGSLLHRMLLLQATPSKAWIASMVDIIVHGAERRDR